MRPAAPTVAVKISGHFCSEEMLSVTSIGLPGFGPPLATGGGIVFQGGTRDQRLRAYDSDTGAVLATFELPAGLHAGPITYKARPEGKQFLVVAPGGHVGLRSKLGDYVIAFALPG